MSHFAYSTLSHEIFSWFRFFSVVLLFLWSSGSCGSLVFLVLVVLVVLWFLWFSGACGSLVLLILVVLVVLWFFCFSSSCGSHGFRFLWLVTLLH